MAHVLGEEIRTEIACRLRVTLRETHRESGHLQAKRKDWLSGRKTEPASIVILNLPASRTVGKKVLLLFSPSKLTHCCQRFGEGEAGAVVLEVGHPWLGLSTKRTSRVREPGLGH